jgi:leader peptidase (prepilin peptidase) / N-methyltransferase
VAATLIIYGLFGLCIGSFLNVVIWRVPQGMSIVSPGSACPSCGRELKAWENVPVVAWVALRGRCRTCHATISWRYPAVELATGAVFAALGARLGWGIAPAACVGAAGVLSLALVGFDTRRFDVRIATVTAVLTAVTAFAGLAANRMIS